MADQAINALSTKTAPETSDQLLLVGAGEPQLIDYDKLADAILNKITSKNYALDAGTMTLTAALNALNGKTLINAYMGTGLQRDYVLNGMSTYIFFMSFVGDGSIVSTFFAVITTGDNASKTGKILWVGNSAENYVSLTDGVTLHLHITSSIWMQCALAKV
jgi:hypothetical protein